MKRFLILCLTAALLFSLCGCGGNDNSPDTVEFYYQRATYVYGASDGVITSETREIANRANTLPYLLSLYFRGPVDENLIAPFPAGTRLLSVTQDGSTLCVTLDSSFTALKNMELTVACSCIARTCFALAAVTQVQIRSTAPDDADSINMILSVDSLLLDDNSGLAQQTASEETQ